MENHPERSSADAARRGGRDRNTAPDLGDADAVEKTTYVSDARGADAAGQTPRDSVTASVPHDRGLGTVGWVALVLAALVIVAYATGVLG